jgi:acyl carrier protein
MLAPAQNLSMEKHMTTAISEEQIKEAVTKYISTKFRVNFGTGVSEQTDLFQEGLIDSFGFIELVSFLEKTFGIKFEDKEFTSNSLNTVTNIVATVKRKTAG